MKRLFSVIMIITLCLCSFMLGTHVSKAYTAKSTRGYYNTSLTSGIASMSNTIISGMGIGFTTHTPIADPSLAIFKSAMNTHETVFVHCHGAPGVLQPQNGGSFLYGTTVSSWSSGCLSSKLVYLSACQTGTASSTYGDLPVLLTQKGVETVVSFKQIISASTSTNGIHRYNELTVTNMVYGYPLAQSMSMAQTTFIAECNSVGIYSYYGATSYRITGNGNYMIVHS